jgi:outer membrane protein assembly factor BamD
MDVRIGRVGILFLVALFLNGCSLTGKEKRESITGGLSPKALFDEAKKHSSGSPDRAIELYEQLQAAYPASKYAPQAKIEKAYTFYLNGEYENAIKALNSYIRLYPKESSTAYAYYLRGKASEKKSSSILDGYWTDNAQRDVDSVKDAFNYYLLLINNFPKSKYSEEAKGRLIAIRNTLARHELFVAIFYTKRGANIAAINRSKYIIEKFPNTPSVPAALHLMARNYDQMDVKNLAKDTRRVIEESYPEYEPHYEID